MKLSRRIVRPPQIRMIPLVIAMASLLLAIRVYDLTMNGRALSSLIASEAVAADPVKEEADGDEEKTDNAQGDEEGEHSGDDNAKDEEHGDGHAEEAKMPIDGRDDVTFERPVESAIGQEKAFSNIELDLLQSLSKRREKIDGWENDLKMKEKLLSATELRIDTKLGELKALQMQVQGLLDAYEEIEETEIRSLVKIYESMKPKKAAAILNDLELGILLQVVDGMSERKAAPVLSAMSPKTAAKVTEHLAEKRKASSAMQNTLER